MKKTILLITICIFLISGCVTQPVSGASTASSVGSENETTSSTASTPVLKDGDYEYKIESGSVTILKYNGAAENVTIPDTIAGLPVKVIGESAFEENKTLKGVSIPDGVVSIGKSAFKYCWNLANIKMSKNIEQIGESAFDSCPIANINLGNHLKSIGKYAFSSCDNLKTITISDGVTIGDGAFAESGIEKFTFPSDMKTVPSRIFETALNLKEVILPPHCETIGAGAFRENCKLSEIFIPDSVTDISPYAFDECPRELVLLYDNNPLVPKFAEEHNILCFKRSEYNPVLTVELVNGKPLNDVKNLGISQEDYNIVKRQSKVISDEIYISNEYINFWDDEKLTDDAVKAKLTKTATLLYQCGITDFDPADISNVNMDYLDKMAIFALYSRSNMIISEEDKKGSSGVLFADEEKFNANYEIFFGVAPDFSKVTGYSQQQKGIWYFPMEFPKVQTEVLSFSGNADKMEYTLKLRFTPESGSPVEKTLTFKLTENGTMADRQHRVTLMGMK